MISVVILADIRLYREGLADVLGRQPDIRVVGTAATDTEGIACVGDTNPDVALIDMAMLDSAGIVRSLGMAAPSVKVLALAVPETDSHVLACAEAGIAGYVPREGAFEDLLAALHGVARGEAFCSPRIISVLLRRIATLTVQQDPAATRLTPRELEILDLIDRRLTNREIAERLCIELATVKNHVHNILEKLQIRGRGDAAAWVRTHRRLERLGSQDLDRRI